MPEELILVEIDCATTDLPPRDWQPVLAAIVDIHFFLQLLMIADANIGFGRVYERHGRLIGIVHGRGDGMVDDLTIQPGDHAPINDTKTHSTCLSIFSIVPPLTLHSGSSAYPVQQSSLYTVHRLGQTTVKAATLPQNGLVSSAPASPCHTGPCSPAGYFAYTPPHWSRGLHRSAVLEMDLPTWHSRWSPRSAHAATCGQSP